MVKKQSWEKRRERSKKIKETAQVGCFVCLFVLPTHSEKCLEFCVASKILLRDGGSAGTIGRLQDHLRREMEDHIRGPLL